MFTNVVLNPAGKMAHFKWRWQEHLHDDMLITAEEVVS